MAFSIMRAAGALMIGAVAAGLFTPPAQAATQEEFLAACLLAAGEESTELCTCKAEQATLLTDATMMDFIIMRLSDPQAFSAAVKAGEVPEDVVERWPYYVRDSNAVCLADDATGS